jgi:hydroxyethylthiazole kinase
MNIITEIAENLSRVKSQQPLVHHLTNYVTVNDCANIVLAIGASPVMADDEQEVEEMVSFAGALVLNIGTLNARTIASMLKAGKKAKALHIPVILDPVGVGATTLRTQTAHEIIAQVRPDVIRGNMSEIKVLSGLNVGIKGVDSIANAENGTETARNLAQRLNGIIAITGKDDIIASPDQSCIISNGHPRLSQVTGTGCMATALIGAYCAASPDLFTATAAGIMTMGLAGEMAYREQEGIGTFKVRLFDAISLMTPDTLRKNGKIIHEKN